MTIPWVIAGPAVTSGRRLQEPVSIIDNPTTIAALLKVAPARDWADKWCGKPSHNEPISPDNLSGKRATASAGT